jgi:putative colanic acid biosynthesis glycosyltransferase WcaI
MSGTLPRIVMLCDWLPPDFGAVGQYAVQFARTVAEGGAAVTLIGFSSTSASVDTQDVGSGSLTMRRIRISNYDRSALLRRSLWTLRANLALVRAALRLLRGADEVQFTGSPPYLIHFILPVAKLFGVRTRYRITDFHPECLVAALQRTPLSIRLLQGLTNFWRRRVDVIEVLGEDQRRRLRSARVRSERIELRRDGSPVKFGGDIAPAAVPPALAGRKIILYSGNWGVAHDHATFVEGFARFCARHPDVAGLWVNATGKRADIVAEELRARGLPFVRTQPVELDALAPVLLAADVHLIALDDRFVGLVLPSKVYACVASGRAVLFVGSEASDVDLVCRQGLPPHRYQRVDMHDAAGVEAALCKLLLPLHADSREQRSVQQRD